jgi:hypothetical protein
MTSQIPNHFTSTSTSSTIPLCENPSGLCAQRSNGYGTLGILGRTQPSPLHLPSSAPFYSDQLPQVLTTLPASHLSRSRKQASAEAVRPLVSLSGLPSVLPSILRESQLPMQSHAPAFLCLLTSVAVPRHGCDKAVFRVSKCRSRTGRPTAA